MLAMQASQQDKVSKVAAGLIDVIRFFNSSSVFYLFCTTGTKAKTDYICR